jgi:hypothetical protein
MRGKLLGAINTAPGVDIPAQYANEAEYYRHVSDFANDGHGIYPCLVCHKSKGEHRWVMSVDAMEQDCSEVAA